MIAGRECTAGKPAFAMRVIAAQQIHAILVEALKPLCLIGLVLEHQLMSGVQCKDSCQVYWGYSVLARGLSISLLVVFELMDDLVSYVLNLVLGH